MQDEHWGAAAPQAQGCVVLAGGDPLPGVGRLNFYRSNIAATAEPAKSGAPAAVKAEADEGGDVGAPAPRWVQDCNRAHQRLGLGGELKLGMLLYCLQQRTQGQRAGRPAESAQAARRGGRQETAAIQAGTAMILL